MLFEFERGEKRDNKQALFETEAKNPVKQILMIQYNIYSIHEKRLKCRHVDKPYYCILNFSILMNKHNKIKKNS